MVGYVRLRAEFGLDGTHIHYHAQNEERSGIEMTVVYGYNNGHYVGPVTVKSPFDKEIIVPQGDKVVYVNLKATSMDIRYPNMSCYYEVNTVRGQGQPHYSSTMTVECDGLANPTR